MARAAHFAVGNNLGNSRQKLKTGMHKKPIKAIAKETRCELVPGEIRTVIIAA
jgi:hypothetical protein